MHLPTYNLDAPLAGSDNLSDDLFDAYFNFLVEATCPFDIAEQKGIASRPKHRRSAGTLIRNMRGDGRPDGLTFSMVRSHLAGSTILHTHPQRGAKEVWLQIDLDRHHGEAGLEEASCLLHAMIPGMYQEPSTRGRGLHLYAWVTSFRSPAVFNACLARCELLTRRLFERAKLEIGVEFRHSYTLLNDVETKVVSRGLLAKAPRPPSGAAFNKLLSGKRYSCPELVDMVEQTCRQRGVSTRVQRTSPLGGLPSQYSSVSRGQKRPGVRNTQVIEKSVIASIQANPKCANAFNRMSEAALLFGRVHSRPPDVGELLDFYQRLYDSDPADADREERAKAAAKYAQKIFDPAKAGHGGFDLESYLPLVKGVLDQFRGHPLVRYRNQLVDEDLAIGLYCAERSSFIIKADHVLQYSMAQGSIVAMFKKLKAAGATTRGCNANKEVAIKKILNLAGLIKYLDCGYMVGKVGQKIGIGPRHPRYPEFQRFLAKFPVITAKNAARMEKERINALTSPVSTESGSAVKSGSTVQFGVQLPSRGQCLVPRRQAKDRRAEHRRRMARNDRERLRRQLARDLLKQWGYRKWGGTWPVPPEVEKRVLRRATVLLRNAERPEINDVDDFPPVSPPSPAAVPSASSESPLHELA